MVDLSTAKAGLKPQENRISAMLFPGRQPAR
jgi:hypothetical protein